MSLADLTAPAVEAAIAEYDAIGGTEFLAKYGFREARRYWLIHNGKRYPSKAIAGAAHRYIGEQSTALQAANFTGGDPPVAKRLRQLGFEVEAPARNPDWSRDELILALDLYFTNPANPPGKDSVAVAKLSDLLNKMHRLNGVEGSDTLRNQSGIYMKMMNIRAIDPTFIAQGKVGMQSGGALEKIVWADYEGRRADLAADAKTIRDAITNADEDVVAKLPTVEPYEGEEGGVVVRLHRRYERDAKLIAAKKAAAKAAGSLACEVCEFDFAKRYGEIGIDFIEVHHVKPVHMIKPGEKTKLSDLALLCSNCHRMAHRRRIPLTLIELRVRLVKST